jgi:hypothetical protein
MFFLRPSTSEWPAHPPHPRLIPPSQLAFTPYQPPSSPVLHFIKILISSGFSGLFALHTPPLAAHAIPLLPYFISFHLIYVHSSLNELFSLIITQLIMLIFL